MPRTFRQFSFVAIVLMLILTTFTSAHIYEWEWIDPSDISKGKQESSIICPGGSGVNAVPNADLYGHDLTRAWLIEKDLTGANFCYATLANADLTDTVIAGAYFRDVTSRGFTADQLYSTASYKTKDLQGIGLSYNDFASWDFSGQNLTKAFFNSSTLTNANLFQANLTEGFFYYANLTDADLTQTNLTKARFNSSTLINANLFQANLTGGDFSSTDSIGANLAQANLTKVRFNSSTLINANLSKANLTDTDFYNATLTDVNLTDAVLTGADFRDTTSRGFTADQLYSTASYQAKDLQRIGLEKNDLTGWNLSGQNLANSNLRNATLTNTDLTDAMVTGANFSDTTSRGFTAAQLYSTASYQAKDLQKIQLSGNDLTGWDFSSQNLAGADFRAATLTNTDLTDAVVTSWANFSGTTSRGFTADQLYSTASYKAKDLQKIQLSSNDLTGWGFFGQNLTNASFEDATLTNTDLTDAMVTGASFCNTTSRGFTADQLYSTASYKAKNLQGIKLKDNDLTGWDFSGQNLYYAFFFETVLTNVDFTDSTITGTCFRFVTSRGFIPAQLYSTASYKNKDLRMIDFCGNDLTGWNFADQNLIWANFGGTTLTNANFRQANLMNARFDSANLTNANLSLAELRGTFMSDLNYADTTNAILSDGRIEGLNLKAGEFLTFRDYNLDQFSNPASIPVLIEDNMTLASEAGLKFVFTDAEWGSTISFDEGIAVNLDGLLDLTFADGLNPADLVGTTFDLFNWDGVSPAGVFASILDHGLVWDISDLYTTGEVTLVAVPEPAIMTFLLTGGLTLLRRRIV